MPWSPAPCPSSEPLSTPRFMSSLCSWMALSMPHESPSNWFYRAARYGLQVDVHRTAHLAGYHRLARRYESLDGHAGLVVVGQELVEYCV